MDGDVDNWSYKTCKAPAKRHHHHANTQLFQAGCPSRHPNKPVNVNGEIQLEQFVCKARRRKLRCCLSVHCRRCRCWRRNALAQLTRQLWVRLGRCFLYSSASPAESFIVVCFVSARETGLKVGPGRQGRRPGTLWFAGVYTGSLVYSLVALNRIKYHQQCIKTRHFQIKNR